MKTKYILTLFISLLTAMGAYAQSFSGKVTDEKGKGLANASIYLLEEDITISTNKNGIWSLQAGDNAAKTIVFHKEGYTYEQILNQKPTNNLTIKLRKEFESFATQRETKYVKNGCANVKIPHNKKWDVSFKQTPLKGDLAPNPKYSRRDPSAVILVDGKYYMWYSYSLTFDTTKIAPWDLNDIYYASSDDGYTWKEHVIAVGRGKPGAFDARSVFTTEIYAESGKYYLVYQAAADEDGIYNRNTVGMAYANSPHGPWTKLEDPILHPTYTNKMFFDNNAVHDPCIVPYQGKYYLYYKGECNCQGADGCVRWCNPVCGLKKQVKWGVAIADSPTGPYLKSSTNPVTNTGHEVMVWPYKNGMAILQHQDGPEAKSIQFSEDGLNFKVMGHVTNIPEAAGLFRNTISNSDPHAGIQWGVCHVLQWDQGPKGWMYIRRFDIIKK